MSLQFLTIPVSHYCEKARWALERAQLPFVERPSIQVLHYWDTWRLARTLFAPVLLAADRKVCDSTAILRYADEFGTAPPLFPSGEHKSSVERWEDSFDTILGVETRRWMYWLSLGSISNERILRFVAHGVPRWQRTTVRWVMPVAKIYLRWRLKVTRDNVDAGLEQLRAVFAEVSAELRDGRRYLVSERFTAADLTFASLSALILLPSKYGVPMFDPAELPPWARDVVEEFRATPAGRYALRIYEEER